MLVVVLLLPLSLAMDNGVAAKMAVDNGAAAAVVAVAAVAAVAVAFDGVRWRRQHSTEATQQPAGAVRGRHNKRTRGWHKEG